MHFEEHIKNCLSSVVQLCVVTNRHKNNAVEVDVSERPRINQLHANKLKILLISVALCCTRKRPAQHFKKLHSGGDIARN